MAEKDKAYYERVYNACHGAFYPMRDHDTEFGWAVVHRESGAIFGLIGDKGSCFGVCAMLNGDIEAAQEFTNHVAKIDLEYMKQFSTRTKDVKVYKCE